MCGKGGRWKGKEVGGQRGGESIERDYVNIRPGDQATDEDGCIFFTQGDLVFTRCIGGEGVGVRWGERGEMRGRCEELKR